MSRIKIFSLIILITFFLANFINAQNVRPIVNVYDSENLGAYAPPTMNPGSKYNVWITMQNVGAATWSPGIDGSPQYSLRTFGTSERAVYDWGVVSVPLTQVVQPGEVHRFEFTVTAPWSAGSYDFQWRMTRGDEFFGEASKIITVNIVPGISVSPGTDIYASFFSADLPKEMVAGETYNASVTMLNTGKTSWTPGYQWLTFFDSKTDASINLAGIDRIGLDREIKPGENVTLNFTLTAPESPGAYNYQWRMANASGTFGELTETMRLYVIPNPNRAADVRVIDRVVVPTADVYSHFNSQSIPGQMVAGERYNAIVRMTNTGRTNWVPGLNWLTFLDSRAGVNTTGINRLGLDREVRPGETVAYSFTITAPETPGTYQYQWRMANANGTYGELTEVVRVNVIRGSVRDM
jgi:hypothetical protein